MPGKKVLLFILLVVAVISAMTYQVRKGAIDPLAPVNRAFYGFSGSLQGAYRAFTGFFVDISANSSRVKELKKQLLEMKARYEKASAGASETQRLKALLDLKEHTPQYVATANVVARGAGRWANTFTIDAGREQGIQKDMIAVAPEGLVGKVIRAENGYSLVLLITDARFSAAVRLMPGNQEAILSGSGADDCILKYVTYDIKVAKGDAVTTSGLDGIFPEGVNAGRVSKVVDEEGFFRKIDVTPSADISSIEQVTIIKRDAALSAIPVMGNKDEGQKDETHP